MVVTSVGAFRSLSGLHTKSVVSRIDITSVEHQSTMIYGINPAHPYSFSHRRVVVVAASRIVQFGSLILGWMLYETLIDVQSYPAII
jgi:hypothetical protein